MKSFVILMLMFFSTLFIGCNKHAASPDKTDGDDEIYFAEFEIDQDTEELEEEIEISMCHGSCEIEKLKYCAEDNICVCEKGTWTEHSCHLLCASDDMISKGCINDEQCLCGYPEDGDDDGYDDTERSCIGPCDENFKRYCSDGINICACNEETGQLEEHDCNKLCMETCGPLSCHAFGCESYGYDRQAVCNFHCCDECTDDKDCQAHGLDYCVYIGRSRVCVKACEMRTCPGTNDKTGCMDIGFGNGCGICWDLENADSCNSSGECCGNNKVCTDVCGVFPEELKCMEMCEAAPSTCAPDETCMPLEIDSDGTIGGGYCFGWTDLNCDTCGENLLDGDMELETDWEVEGMDCNIDGDQEKENSDSENEIEIEQTEEI